MHWIFAHLIGDYLLQNDWMAKGKKSSSLVCLVHVVSYMLPFLFVGAQWWQLLAIAVQHYAQDRTKVVVWFLNATGRAEFAKPPMAPWSIIVVDNILHICLSPVSWGFNHNDKWRDIRYGVSQE